MKKILIVVLVLVIGSSLFAGRYAGDFMAVGAGVRAIGLGGAYTAIADDASAIYWNAAGVSQIRDFEFNLMSAFLYNGLARYELISACVPLPNDVTIGLNITGLIIDDIPIYNESHIVGTNVDQRSTDLDWIMDDEEGVGVNDGTFRSADYLFQFAFAKHLHYDLNMGWLFFELPFDLHFGGNIKYIARDILENTGNGTGFDFSVIAKTDLGVLLDLEWLGKISWGLNMQDIGGTVVTWDVQSNHEDEILFNTKTGVAIFQPLNFIKSNLILSADKDYVYKGVSHYGAELNYAETVSLRAGYYDSNFSTGFGVQIYDYILDYAFVTNTLGSTNRVGIRALF
jgi:hypothetical protein